jgi:putative ABC transport system permease protein
MLKNYLFTILRQIRKNKLFSFINIFGLALGMAACLVIAQYVHFHTTFDNYHQKGDRIFRLESKAYRNGEELGISISSPAPLTDKLAESVPEIEKVARFYPYNYANSSVSVQGENGIINEEQTGIFGAEKTIFELFDFEFLAGNAATFDEPNKAIMTLKNAKQFFERPLDAVGKQFTLSGNTGTVEYELVGILKDLPPKTHFDFSLLVSYISIDNFTEARTEWNYNSMFAYLLSRESADKHSIQRHVNELFESDGKPFFANSGYHFDFFLQPLTAIHTAKTNADDFTLSVNKTIIYGLSLIAGIILIIAWINYMNLSLARTLERVKEMGVRIHVIDPCNDQNDSCN